MLRVGCAKAIDKGVVVLLYIIFQHRRSLSVKPHKAKRNRAEKSRTKQSKERSFFLNHVSSKAANTYIYGRIGLMIWR